MTAVLFLSAAMLCFQGSCHNALVGKATPAGSFVAVKGRITAPGYPSGKFATFAKFPDGTQLGVHPVYVGSPEQRRQFRLQQDNPALRTISAGCVNLSEKVYDRLPDVFDLEILE